MERYFMGVDDIILAMAREKPAFKIASVEKRDEVEKKIVEEINATLRR